MKTLEELRKENAKLKAIKEVQNDFTKREIERKRLILENRKLKYSGAYSIASKTAGVAKATVKAFGNLGKEHQKKLLTNQKHSEDIMETFIHK